MRIPWARRHKPPYTPLPPVTRKRPAPVMPQHITDVERQSRETATRIERSTNDLLLLLAEIERRNDCGDCHDH